MSLSFCFLGYIDNRQPPPVNRQSKRLSMHQAQANEIETDVNTQWMHLAGERVYTEETDIDATESLERSANHLPSVPEKLTGLNGEMLALNGNTIGRICPSLTFLFAPCTFFQIILFSCQWCFPCHIILPYFLVLPPYAGPAVDHRLACRFKGTVDVLFCV